MTCLILCDARAALENAKHAEELRLCSVWHVETFRSLLIAFSLQEYLEYQRQLALQRMHEQEREMQMRFEQQQQMQHMRAMQTYYPQV